MKNEFLQNLKFELWHFMRDYHSEYNDINLKELKILNYDYKEKKLEFIYKNILFNYCDEYIEQVKILKNDLSINH